MPHGSWCSGKAILSRVLPSISSRRVSPRPSWVLKLGRIEEDSGLVRPGRARPPGAGCCRRHSNLRARARRFSAVSRPRGYRRQLETAAHGEPLSGLIVRNPVLARALDSRSIADWIVELGTSTSGALGAGRRAAPARLPMSCRSGSIGVQFPRPRGSGPRAPTPSSSTTTSARGTSSSNPGRLRRRRLGIRPPARPAALGHPVLPRWTSMPLLEGRADARGARRCRAAYRARRGGILLRCSSVGCDAPPRKRQACPQAAVACGGYAGLAAPRPLARLPAKGPRGADPGGAAVLSPIDRLAPLGLRTRCSGPSGACGDRDGPDRVRPLRLSIYTDADALGGAEQSARNLVGAA